MSKQNQNQILYEECHLVDNGSSIAVSAREFFHWTREKGGHRQSPFFLLAIQLAEFLLSVIQRALKIRFLVRVSPKNFTPELLKTWKALLDNDVIISVLRLPQYDGYPANFCYSLRLGDIKERTDGHSNFLIANIGGADFMQKHLALERAFAEAIERFAYLIYHEQELLFCHASELPARALDPLKCILWRSGLDAQNPTPLLDQPFGWAEGKSYPDEERIFIPAQLVFWNYRRRTGEPFLREPNTNGAAVHRSKVEAMQNGLLELIERDALMNAWFAKLSPKQIIPASLPPEVRAEAAIDVFDKSPLTTHLLWLPTDAGVPVVGAALIDRSGKGSIISFGSSAAFELHAAIVKAVREAFTVYIVERERKRAKTRIASANLSSSPNEFRFLTFAGRMELWWHQEAFGLIEHLLHGERQTYSEVQSGFPPANLNVLVSRIRHMGYGVLYHKADVPWMKDLGYHAVKVVVPELQPLYLDERRWGCNLKRLNEWCLRLQIPRPEKVNTTPHPFP